MNKIMIYLIVIVAIVLIGAVMYMRHFTKNTPSVVDNEYSKEMEVEVNKVKEQGK